MLQRPSKIQMLSCSRIWDTIVASAVTKSNGFVPWYRRGLRLRCSLAAWKFSREPSPACVVLDRRLAHYTTRLNWSKDHHAYIALPCLIDMIFFRIRNTSRYVCMTERLKGIADGRRDERRSHHKSAVPQVVRELCVVWRQAVAAFDRGGDVEQWTRSKLFSVLEASGPKLWNALDTVLKIHARKNMQKLGGTSSP